MLDDINAVLTEYDLSTETGRLAYLVTPVSIKVNTYAEEKAIPIFPDVVLSDFVLHTEVTWNSQTGLAGCNIIFRSDGNLDRGKQYQFNMLRLQGLPLWDVEYHNLGRFQNNLSNGIRETGALFSDQGSTNVITLIAQGNKISIYSNGERLGIMTDSKLTSGSLAFAAFQESGETTCRYENTWVWDLKGATP